MIPFASFTASVLLAPSSALLLRYPDTNFSIGGDLLSHFCYREIRTSSFPPRGSPAGRTPWMGSETVQRRTWRRRRMDKPMGSRRVEGGRSCGEAFTEFGWKLARKREEAGEVVSVRF